jgi:hypothetical protein
MALFWANGIRKLLVEICGKHDAYVQQYFNRRSHYIFLYSHSESWHDVWDDVQPLIYAVMNDGESVFLKEARYWMTRFGWMEETYFTYQVRASFY